MTVLRFALTALGGILFLAGLAVVIIRVWLRAERREAAEAELDEFAVRPAQDERARWSGIP